MPREGALAEYKERLIQGTVFSRNRYGGCSRALLADINRAESALIILCELGPDPVKPWAISKVTIEGNELCHKNLGSCFAREGAEKRYCEALGLTWEGGDSIDDYC